MTRKDEKCPHCRGSGREEETALCPNCEGTGCHQCWGGYVKITTHCAHCGGTGKTR